MMLELWARPSAFSVMSTPLRWSRVKARAASRSMDVSTPLVLRGFRGRLREDRRTGGGHAAGAMDPLDLVHGGIGPTEEGDRAVVGRGPGDADARLGRQHRFPDLQGHGQ